jgi:hypothetical protein
MTWDELIEHVRGKWRVAIDSRDKLGLLWTITGTPDPDDADVPEPDEQREMVELIHGAGEPYVRISAEVVHEDSLSSLEAVRHNMTLAVGALALDRTTYVLRAVLPLDVLSTQVLDRSLELVAREAARIRRSAKRRITEAD